MNNDLGKRAVPYRSTTTVREDGLSSYMQKVYGLMALGLGISAVAAYLIASSASAIHFIFGTNAFWGVVFLPLALVILLSSSINRLSVGASLVVFSLYAASVGVSLSSIFLLYTADSIASTFLVVMLVFGCMSLYGYTTKKDLSSFGSFLMMGFFGLLISMIVNLFLKNSFMDFALSVVGVLIFTGLTAYHTNYIRMTYSQTTGGEALKKGAIMGALVLYMNFINLFVHLLRLLGNKK